MIQFIFPAALYLGLSIPFLFLLYMIKSSPQKKKISSNLIWQKVLNKRPPEKALFQRFVSSPFFYIHLLLFLILSLLIAQPFYPVSARKSVVYLLDCSVSMNFRDMANKKSRFERAKEALIQHIKLNTSYEYSLLTFDSTIHPILMNSKDSAKLITACRNLVVSDLPNGSIAELEDSLKTMLPADCFELIIFSDEAVFSESLTQKILNRISYFFFRGSGNNLSILHLSGFVEGKVFKTRLIGENTTRYPQLFSVNVTDSSGAQVKSIKVQSAGQSRWQTPLLEISCGDTTTGYLKFSLSNLSHPEKNSFTEDDVVYWNFVTAKTTFTKKTSLPIPVEKLLKYLPLKLTESDGYPVLGRFTPASLPKKSGLYFIRDSSCQSAGSESVRSHYLSHPVMSFCQFHFPNIKKRAFFANKKAGLKSFLSDEKGSLLSFRENSGERQIFLFFDLLQSDFIRQVSFPIFIKNALEWIGGKSLDNQGLFPVIDRRRVEASFSSENPPPEIRFSLVSPSESKTKKQSSFTQRGRLKGREAEKSVLLGGVKAAPSLMLYGILLLIFLYLADSFLLGFTTRIGV